LDDPFADWGKEEFNACNNLGGHALRTEADHGIEVRPDAANQTTFQPQAGKGSQEEDERWSFDEEMQEYIVPCPHCTQPHLVPTTELFCCQFVCGADAHTGQPLRVQMSAEDVSKLMSQGRVVGGCGGRFKFDPRKRELSAL